jgi:hypothetical protein
MAEERVSADVSSWFELFEREVEARKRLTKSLQDNNAADGKRLRHWWSTVEHLLRGYAISVERRKRPEPPPSELATVLADLAGYLARGQIPQPISDVKVEGRRPLGPSERRDTGWAIAYRNACGKNGILHNGERICIPDPAPIKTLAGWFSVHPRTVRGWLKRYPPALLGVNKINADVIKYRTRKAGARYSKCGRGQKAVYRRRRRGESN